jgi:nucleoside-diphosphate-sugar epimerase
MKKVLITGANGFTGRHLVQSLEGTDWEVIPMDVTAGGLRNEVTVDFCDEDFIGRLRELPKVDAVVHLGTRVGWDGGTRAELFQPNVLATAELVRWAKEMGSLFIFASAALIGGERNPHITADCPLNTENDYLYSKWLAEKIIEMSGIRHSILRISGIFGAHGPTHLGINNAITGALEGKPPVRFGDGKIKRNYIYVKDLCRTIIYCLDNPAVVEGRHLVGGTRSDTIAEMLQVICEELLPGKSPEVKPGKKDYNQVVDPSPILPETRGFREAVRDIKNKLNG